MNNTPPFFIPELFRRGRMELFRSVPSALSWLDFQSGPVHWHQMPVVPRSGSDPPLGWFAAYFPNRLYGDSGQSL